MPTAVPVVETVTRALKAIGLSKEQLTATTKTPAEIVSSLSVHEKVFLLSGSSFVRTSGLSKFDLHPAKTSDGPTDIRGDTVLNAPHSIVIPNATALASTWDLEAIRGIGSVLGGEAKWKEVDILLAPNLNLHRDPRGGRNQESYGEDAFLAGKCGAAFGNGVQSQGVAICPKHLVCNDSETERRFYDSIVDEQTLREVYLRPFEIIVEEAKPASIMTSYNRINAHSAAENKKILDIVRDEWKWDGMFMSDWFGTYNGVESVKAGMDLEMPFPAARGGQLLKALSDGTLSESDLDPLCQRVVKFLQTVKPLDPAQRQVDRPSPISPKDVAANRQIAGDGIILLKNDGILPLDVSDKSKTVAVIGPLATDKVLTHLICPSYIVNPLEGITSALAQHARKPVHVHGPYSHKDVPVLDGRFTPSITFHKWNIGDRTADAKSPVSTDTYHHAIEALLMRPIPGLDPEYEIEMVSSVTPDVTGSYVLSLRATWDAEVYINGTRVYSYRPGGPVDIQKFLFHSHGIAQTFTYTFDANKTYDIRVVVQSQPQAGSEPMAQGLLFGLILDRTEEDLLAEAIAAAQAAEEVILCVGTTSEWEMEGVDRADIQLPKSQARLAREIIKANPRTILVNQSGSAVDLGPAMDAAAIVHAHFSGQECGNAVADVIFGKVNPSGRTTYTWPKAIEDGPAFANFPCDADLNLRYDEGMSMGYRGYLARDVEPAFCFGHGLSYTTFSASDAKLDVEANGKITVSTTITNTGDRAGREVVQLYVSKPNSKAKSLEGFAKTPLLQPGQSALITIELNQRSFAHWSTETGGWVIASGEYRLDVARSVSDTIAELSYSVEENKFL